MTSTQKETRSLCDLYHTEAILRKYSVQTGALYDILLNLNKGDSYRGIVRIRFQALQSENVFLDFCGDRICSLVVNGTTVDILASNCFRDGHIFIDPALVKVNEENTVQISFENRYYTDGNGVHTFTDVDGCQYLYI